MRDTLLRLQRHLGLLVSSPKLRWPAVATISVYLIVQVVSVALQSILPHRLKSGFGFNIPWQMFASPPPFRWWLEAVAVTPSGQRIIIPVHSEIFTHYRGLSQIRAFEEASWLMAPAPHGDMKRKEELAIFLRDRMLAWGVEATTIELRARTLFDDPSKPPLPPMEIGSFPMTPPDPPSPPSW